MIEEAISALSLLQESLAKIIRGRDDTIKLLVTGIVADGHVLIEDYPGSGKTTTLLELAQELIYVANQDPSEPIPVILNLASWREKETMVLLSNLMFGNTTLIPSKRLSCWGGLITT